MRKPVLAGFGLEPQVHAPGLEILAVGDSWRPRGSSPALAPRLRCRRFWRWRIPCRRCRAAPPGNAAPATAARARRARPSSHAPRSRPRASTILISSTLSNWWTRIMPRVPTPAAPGFAAETGRIGAVADGQAGFPAGFPRDGCWRPASRRWESGRACPGVEASRPSCTA